MHFFFKYARLAPEESYYLVSSICTMSVRLCSSAIVGNVNIKFMRNFYYTSLVLEVAMAALPVVAAIPLPGSQD